MTKREFLNLNKDELTIILNKQVLSLELHGGETSQDIRGRMCYKLREFLKDFCDYTNGDDSCVWCTVDRLYFNINLLSEKTGDIYKLSELKSIYTYKPKGVKITDVKANLCYPAYNYKNGELVFKFWLSRGAAELNLTKEVLPFSAFLDSSYIKTLYQKTDLTCELIRKQLFENIANEVIRGTDGLFLKLLNSGQDGLDNFRKETRDKYKDLVEQDVEKVFKEYGNQYK